MFSDDEIIMFMSTQHMPEYPLTKKSNVLETRCNR